MLFVLHNSPWQTYIPLSNDFNKTTNNSFETLKYYAIHKTYKKPKNKLHLSGEKQDFKTCQKLFHSQRQ